MPFHAAFSFTDSKSLTRGPVRSWRVLYQKLGLVKAYGINLSGCLRFRMVPEIGKSLSAWNSKEFRAH
eukprot:s1060_g12.t1